ncbi:MAG: SDR family NAD(P)-dependent oxidoreductase [Ferruginibacter sp.]
MEISQARILITGGGRGIGNFIANGLLEKAAKIIVVDHDEQLLNNLPLHENLKKYKCDITDPSAVECLINQIFETAGGINVCINNAGIIHSEPLVNILSRAEKKHSVGNWQKVMDVNLNAVFYITSNVAEHMMLKRQKGVIINVSSISAQGNAGQSAYAASKAAVEALTKTWSKELSMFKIRCACIAPGFFDTPSTQQSLTENMLSKMQKAVPLARLGELKELLSAVEFIIENEYFNGKVLALDGGLIL